MRILVSARLPHEPFNTAVRNGTAGATLGKIIEDFKREAVYFTEEDGQRCALFVVNVEKASDIPAFGEPLFLKFNADCRFRVVMTPPELQQAGLEHLAKKWA